MESQTAKTAPDSRTLTKETNVIAWKAPVRPFKKRSKNFFSTVVLLAILLSIIGYVLEGIMVVALIWAVVLLTFALFTVEPEEVEYSITNKHIVLTGRKYPFEEIARFWITQRWGQKLLVFDMPMRFPGRLEIVLGDTDPKKVQEALEEYILFEEQAPGFADRAAAWFSKRLSLDG